MLPLAPSRYQPVSAMSACWLSFLILVTTCDAALRHETTQSAPCELIEEMNKWAASSAKSLTAAFPAAVAALHGRVATLNSFCAGVFPQVVHSLPVLYLFSGMDLLTAHGCFPHAPQYALLADFGTGDPECFASPSCLLRANESAFTFFQHWANLGFSRQSTNVMRRTFASKVGVLPALLLCLRLIGETASSVRIGEVRLPPNSTNAEVAIGRKGRTNNGHGGGGHGNAGHGDGHDDGAVLVRSLTIQTGSRTVTYVSLFFRLDASEHTHPGRMDWPSVSRWAKGSPFIKLELDAISTAIGGDGGGGQGGGKREGGGDAEYDGIAVVDERPRRLFVSIFKAAPHWILRNDWMASWVLRTSFATLQDETGLRPQAYNTSSLTGDEWTSTAHGRFRQFEAREVKWYGNERSELEKAFPGPELPFRFGYAQYRGNNGTLLTGWRTSIKATINAPQTRVV